MQLVNFTNNFCAKSKRILETKIVPSSAQEKTILLIDDEETVINISEMMLIRLGYRVLKAHSGYEGLKLFKENKSTIDLIISDLEMPKMNGIEALKLIRKISKDIPVIAVTAYAHETDKQEILNAGFNDYIAKPLKPERLLEVIKGVI